MRFVIHTQSRTRCASRGHLDFLAGSSLLQHIDVQASGCQWVRLSSTDSRWTTAAFNRLLTNTIGVSSLLPAPSQLTQQYDFTEHDSGRTAVYSVTTRFEIFLNQQQYPQNESPAFLSSARGTWKHLKPAVGHSTDVCSPLLRRTARPLYDQERNLSSQCVDHSLE